MDKITTLVLQYQETKSQIILKEILEILNPIIKKKATYIFYHKFYPLNLYHPCKYCRNCDKLNNVPKSEHSIICKDCEECKCIKGFFNLKKDNLCEYEDVTQDLLLTILQMIDKFIIQIDKEENPIEFNNYLYTTLWEFMPTFLTKDFVKSLSNKSLTQEDNEGNETQIDIPDEQEEVKSKPSIQEILEVCQTDIEKKICELYLSNPNLSQKEIAEKLGTYQRDISRIINKLRKRLKKFV